MQKPTFLNKKITSENKYLRTIQRDFIDSKGRKGNIITLEQSLGTGQGGFIFALTKDKKVILNKEYQFGPDDFIYKFPSGFMETEDNKKGVMQELQEETGYSSDEEVLYIGETTQNGYMNGKNQLFFVNNCYVISEIKTHEGEEIEIELIDLNVFQKMIVNGEILDPYTIANYFLAKEKTNNFINI